MRSKADVPSAGPARPPLAQVLTFHKSIDTISWGATNYAPVRLRRLLRFLVGEGYRLATLGEVTASPENNTIALTFDDGYLHLRDVLPLLMAEFDFQPTVFVPTACIGRDNDWDYSHMMSSCPHLSAGDIAGLARDGVEFGSHSHNHHDLTQTNPGELLAELSRSRDLLKGLTGRPITSVSYPFGRTNSLVFEAAAEAGFEHGFTMAYPEAGQAALQRGRLAIYGFDTPLSVLKKLRPGTTGYRLERWKAALTSRLAGGSVLLARRRRHHQ